MQIINHMLFYQGDLIEKAIEITKLTRKDKRPKLEFILIFKISHMQITNQMLLYQGDLTNKVAEITKLTGKEKKCYTIKSRSQCNIHMDCGNLMALKEQKASYKENHIGLVEHHLQKEPKC